MPTEKQAATPAPIEHQAGALATVGQLGDRDLQRQPDERRERDERQDAGVGQAEGVPDVRQQQAERRAVHLVDHGQAEQDHQGVDRTLAGQVADPLAGMGDGLAQSQVPGSLRSVEDGDGDHGAVTGWTSLSASASRSSPFGDGAGRQPRGRRWLRRAQLAAPLGARGIGPRCSTASSACSSTWSAPRRHGHVGQQARHDDVPSGGDPPQPAVAEPVDQVTEPTGQHQQHEQHADRGRPAAASGGPGRNQSPPCR